MDVQTVVKSFFLGTTVASHVFWLVPSLNREMLAYGARGVDANKNSSASTSKDRAATTLASRLVDQAARLRISHSWFTSFYVYLSVASTLWAQQLYTRGRLFQFVARHAAKSDSSSMAFDQIALVVGLLQIQGLRRLWESLIFAKPSKARMSFVYLVFAIMYYTAMTIAVWVEGIPALLSTRKPLGDPSIGSAPSIRTMVCVPVFILASGVQHDCHRYLHSLKTYQVPDHPAFAMVLSPHYLAEVLIYTSLTVLATPKGRLVNATMLTALLCTVWNLALAADNTKTWYERKFGKNTVVGRYRIIPYVW